MRSPSSVSFRVPAVLSPIRTEQHFLGAYFRVGGDPPRMLQTCSTDWGPTAPFLRFVVIIPVCCQIENGGLWRVTVYFTFIEGEIVSSGRPIKPMLKAQLRSCPLKSETNSGRCSARVNEHIFGALSDGQPPGPRIAPARRHS